eukprot:9404716-Alexandrium_andersonii.AAC.1
MVAVPARPTGQTAIPAARNLQEFGALHNANPSAGGAARSAALHEARRLQQPPPLDSSASA